MSTIVMNLCTEGEVISCIKKELNKMSLALQAFHT